MTNARNALPALLLMLILSCAAEESSVPRPEMEAFFASFNGSQYGRLYDEGSEELKKGVSRESFISFLTTAKTLLGDHSSTESCQTWREVGTRGRYVAQKCEVQFVRGSGTVDVAWKKVDGDLRLYRVNVSSPDLMPKLEAESERTPR